jgi:hypothetical protein
MLVSQKTKGREKFLLDPVLTSMSPQPKFQVLIVVEK